MMSKVLRKSNRKLKNKKIMTMFELNSLIPILFYNQKPQKLKIKPKYKPLGEFRDLFN